MLVEWGRDRARQARSGSSANRQDTAAVTRSLPADRRIRYVLAAYVASGSADGFLPVVLSFAVLRLTGSPGRLGLVLACQSTAALLLTLAGGLAGDRFPRVRILTGSLPVRAAPPPPLAPTPPPTTPSSPLP